VKDIPDFGDYTLRGGPSKSGRTYWYYDGDVSYEFGYGLSYTTFEYANFEIDKASINPNGTATVSVDVTNSGDLDGDEIVQIYVRTPESPASLERPIKRLKGFERVTIPAGQTRTVAIRIDCSDLWFWDPGNDRITFDEGNYVFEVGASSRDIRGQVEAVMSGQYRPVLRTVVAESENIVLKPGNTTTTSVSASLSDDSFIDASKGSVTYKSNNPQVASVDRSGKVTARNPGVASITASVTYDKRDVTDSYPVVMPNSPRQPSR
jgi:hypothetical protein